MTSKFNCVLDIDQTLIAAEVLEEYNIEKNKEKSVKFKFENMDDYYIIFQRPHLQKFLDYLFANFNVSIWTAASKDYALFIIDKIITPTNKPERKIDWVFFSYHCDVSRKIKKSSKDLTMLWDIYRIKGYSIDNTFIIDDYDEVYNSQPNNSIIVPEFQYYDENSENDNFLKKLIKQLKILNNSNSIKHLITINKKNKKLLKN
jgi:TFIIF-interacting CTD phosphatase-like protein